VTIKNRVLAGTALCLLMGGGPLAAYPIANDNANAVLTGRLLLAQAACAEGESAEDCAARQSAEPQTAPEAPAPAPEIAPAPTEEPPPPPVEAPQPAPEQPAPPPVEEPAPAPEQPAPPPAEQPQPAPEQPQPAPEQPAPVPEEVPAQPPEQPAPVPEQPQPAPEQPAPLPEEIPAPPPEQPVPAPETPQPVPEQPQPAPSENPSPLPETVPQQPAPELVPVPEQQPGAEQPTVQPEQNGQIDPNSAPILDSQKEAPAPADGSQPDQQAVQPEPAGPPPKTDADAQIEAQPKEVEPVTAEEGKRIDDVPEFELRNEPRPKGLDVLREIGDRLILQFGDQITVESNDRPRMQRGAREVYYEDLSRGRTRETIIRRDGTRIVTVRDEYGDVIRRSRITEDGREYVLTYVDEEYYDRVRDRRDPGRDLPPMRLTIPVDEYILDAEEVDDPDDYYTFLDQPPVEKVRRLYSVDEVKRSARVRDIARRVDMDTLTFEFGSASIPESEVAKLAGVAEAMQKLLERNPAETFLIEGHTDAVGSNIANLALSDRRAEAVADALTDVFEIPPENLTTQGYGEQYLKVKTQEPERQNRRVGIRRITALVAPVANAN